MTESVSFAIRIDFPSGEKEAWRGPSEAELTKAARAALAAGRAGQAGEAGAGDAAGESAELSVTFLPAESMRALNRDYHGVDDLTDVLAFGLGEDPLVGDIYISPEAAEASAGELGLDPGEEILRLLIHGILHLLGHDHPEGEARYASPMFELQERVLARLLAEFRGRA
ncbi:rRNA maturation RNase YbeY [Candidatus Palauibacter soopunensis]|uniref:rRNA maturation RNase YbeY n=1 Tax=Candidatus Palauibacter soopunensis TaxID=3056739 RepID=UPI002397A983|nr:rRNA maturation RNase YbeY [Candidatus Palauibacter soopunensis]MDE2879251.1 rRNA maturation RNase YbeY [Candidatus Palauibacter soopunensis]